MRPNEKKRVKNEQSLSSLTKKKALEIIVTIVLGAVGSILAFYLLEYYLEPIEKDNNSVYCILDAIPVKTNTINYKTVTGELSKLNEMLLISINCGESMNINYIKIHHVTSLNNFTVYCSQNDINKTITESIKTLFEPKNKSLIISNIPTIPGKSKLIIAIYGEIDKKQCNPVIVLEDNKLVFPIKSGLVNGPQLFLASYWRHILAAIILLIVSLYYFLRIQFYNKKVP